MILLLVVATAGALEPSDPVVLDLAGGTTLEGIYMGAASATALDLRVGETLVQVELALVESATVRGVPTATPELALDVARAWEVQLLPEGPTPLPGLVLASSLLFAGTGHAMLHDGKGFRGYAGVQLVFVGAEAFALLYEQNLGFFVSVAAVDVLCRGIAAGQAHKQARRRRGH